MTVKKYISNVLDGMAKGLFASLIMGVIIKQIGVILNFQLLIELGQTAQYLMGACIGMGVANSRNGKQYTLLSAAVAGTIGAGAIKYIAETGVYTIGIGEPMGALIATLAAIEVGKLVEGKTKFDLLFVPAVIIIIGGITGYFISPVISAAMNYIGVFINNMTTLQPIPMGIILGVVVGMLLTAPVSSAAICIAINISGLAAGAALAGCCAQMVGFAVMSYRENKISGLISQGFGTSMIQVPNIVKKPIIWLPPTIASGICGLLSTTLFKMVTNSVGAGMGSAGLVGQFTVLAEMGTSADVIIKIIILHFILPAIISLVICEIMRKKNIIEFGDLKI